MQVSLLKFFETNDLEAELLEHASYVSAQTYLHALASCSTVDHLDCAAHMDPTKVLVLYTDASLVGWVAVLCQVYCEISG